MSKALVNKLSKGRYIFRFVKFFIKTMHNKTILDILSFIIQNPDCTVNEIKERFSHFSNISNYLIRMRLFKLVCYRTEGKNKRYQVINETLKNYRAFIAFLEVDSEEEAFQKCSVLENITKNSIINHIILNKNKLESGKVFQDLSLEQSVSSSSLTKIKSLGFLSSEREGKYVFYSSNKDLLQFFYDQSKLFCDKIEAIKPHQGYKQWKGTKPPEIANKILSGKK